MLQWFVNNVDEWKMNFSSMCGKVVTVIVLVMCWAQLAHPAAHGQPGHKVI